MSPAPPALSPLPPPVHTCSPATTFSTSHHCDSLPAPPQPSSAVLPYLLLHASPLLLPSLDSHPFTHACSSQSLTQSCTPTPTATQTHSHSLPLISAHPSLSLMHARMHMHAHAHTVSLPITRPPPLSTTASNHQTLHMGVLPQVHHIYPEPVMLFKTTGEHLRPLSVTIPVAHTLENAMMVHCWGTL